MARQLRPYAPIAILLIAIAAIYWPVASFPLTGYDDNGHVGQNPDMNPVTAASVAKYWTGPYMDMYIPVAYTAWSGLALIARTRTTQGWELDPTVFHLANVLLHAASTLLLYAILRRLILVRLPDVAPRAADYAAVAGAGLFAIHPLQVDAVAWVSGLRDVLGGTLAMTAAWLYVAHATGAGRRRWWLYAAGLVAFALSMFSKPSTVTLPLMLLAVDLLVLRRAVRPVVTGLAIWFVVAGAGALSARFAQPASAVVEAPLWTRPLVALDALTMYGWKIVAPVHLAIDYGRSPRWLATSSQLWWTWIPAAAVIVLLLARWRRWPVAACAGVIFVAALLPVLGLVKFEFQRHSTIADRYAYLAMIGLSLGLAMAVVRRPTRTVGVIVAVVLALYAARAHAQVWVWKDTETLFRHTVKVNPTSLAGHTWLGLFEGQSGRMDLALDHFRVALAGHRDDPIANFHYGDLLLYLGRASEAVDPLRRSTLNRPEWYRFLKLSMALDRSGDRPGAVQACRDGLALFPDQPELHELLGAFLAERGDWAAARAEYESALRLDPRRQSARAALAAIERLSRSPASRPATTPARAGGSPAAG